MIPLTTIGLARNYQEAATGRKIHASQDHFSGRYSEESSWALGPRRRHGGGRARVLGQAKVAADFSLLAAAVNLARFGVLGLTHVSGPRWVVTPI